MASPQPPSPPQPPTRRRWLGVPQGGEPDRLLTVGLPALMAVIVVAFAVGAFLKVVDDIPGVLGGIVGGVLVAAIGAGRGGGGPPAPPPESGP